MGAITPFVITLGVCALLGVVLLVVPMLTFKGETYVSQMYTLEPRQYAFEQVGRFDTLLVSSNEPRNVTVRVYAPDALPNATVSMERMTLAHNFTLAPGATAAVLYFVARGTVANLTATGPEGSALTLAALDRAAYRARHAHGTLYGAAAPQAVLPEQHYTTFGAHYAVVENAGTAPARVAVRVVVTSPVYNVTAPEPVPVAMCAAGTPGVCRLQHLPRGYVAFVDVDTRHGPANCLDAAVQHCDALRWGLPAGLYAALVVVVVVACIVELVRHVRRRRHTIRYTAINDPDIDPSTLSA